jgi:hypothetical protein
MNDKSYVTILKCPICQEDTGELLMDRRLKNSFDRYSFHPAHVCEKCRDKYLSDGVMVINPETCGLIVLKDEAFTRLFDRKIPEGKIVYCELEVLEKVQKLYEQHAN